ncbi:MAG: hypothetical protein DBX39_04100 [Bacillota bacterium]|nr:MAG: hypothetical protein DBX39_04100 [Bacillota bacterium]
MYIDLKKNPFFLSDKDIAWVQEQLAAMTEQEKIAQLFCLITYTDDEQYLAYLAGGLKVGGVMTRTMSLSELINTVTRLQKHAKIPIGHKKSLYPAANELTA